MRKMHPNILAKISVRILAIYVIAQGVMNLPSLVTALVYSGNQSGLNGTEKIAVISAISGPLVIGAVLWIAASTISGWIVGEQERLGEERASLAQLQAVAISTAGLVIVFVSLPTLISQFIQVIGGSYALGEQPAITIGLIGNLLDLCLRVIFGLILVFGAKLWTRLLYNLREFGLEQKTRSF